MRLFAHRGSSARCPENTLAAFAAALVDGADGIELDARLTADGRVVVMHDDDVSRTTNGTGRISEMTLGQVRALDAGNGERVPTIEEVVSSFAGRTAIVIEIKGAFGGARTIEGVAVARAILPLIHTVPLISVSSFDPGAIAVVRAHGDHIPTAITVGGTSEPDWGLALAIDAGHAEIHVPEERVAADFIARAHGAGRTVMAYTVNDAARARELESMGLDGIFSDEPSAVR